MGKVLKKCSDERIIQLIITINDEDGNLAVHCIYKMYGQKIKWTLRQKVDPSKNELIEDILTDTILAFFNAIRQRRFELRDDKSIKAYLNRTSRNLLNMEFRSAYKNQPKQKTEMDDIEKYVLNQMDNEDRINFLKKLSNDTTLQEEVELRRQMIHHKWRVEELHENIPEETKSELERVEEMKKLIEELSPMQQQLLTAHYHQDIGLSTFAQMRNMNPDAVRQQHHRCLKKLRELFNQQKEV